eukprot:gene17847-7054_t
MAERLCLSAVGGQILLTGDVYLAVLSHVHKIGSPVLSLVEGGGGEGMASVVYQPKVFESGGGGWLEHLCQCYQRNAVGRLFLLAGIAEDCQQIVQRLVEEEAKRARCAAAEGQVEGDSKGRRLQLKLQARADADANAAALAHAALLGGGSRCAV